MSGADESLRSTGPTLSGSETSETLEATTSAPSMFSPADFPASPSATRGNGKRRTMRGGSGRSLRDSFASYDPDTCSWRTYQASLTGQLETYSETWPRAGTTRSGTAYRLPPLVPHISETEFGLLPTPTASDADTHVADDQRFQSLTAYWHRQIGSGYLNPRYCEPMMGYPLGWTDLEDSATP